MAGYEQCIIVGNVGRDPEMRYLPNSNTPVTNFSVAVTTRWNDRNSGERREKTNWYNCSAFSRQAEVANQYIRKGTQIMVIGTVSARAYTGNDGQPRASLDLRVDNFQLLGSRGDGSSGGGDYDDNFSAPPQDMDDIPF